MLSGERPWERSGSLDEARQRIAEAPSRLSHHRPGLPRRWERTVMRCLEVDPDRRPQSASAIATELGFDSAQPSRRHDLIWLLVVAVIIGWVVIDRFMDSAEDRGEVQLVGTDEGLPEPPLRLRRALVIEPFRNLSEDPELDWVGAAMVELLGTDLAATGRWRVFDDGMHEGYTVDLLLAGSYLVQGEGEQARIRLELRLVDQASGESLVEMSQQGAEEQLFDLVSASASQLRQQLGLPEVDGVALRAIFPENFDGARLYAAGLARQREMSHLAALEFFDRAVATVPEHPLPYLARSRSHAALGFDVESAVDAAAAWKRAESLPHDLKLEVEARWHESAGRWPDAVAIHRSLFHLSPDDVDRGLGLVACLIRSGQGSEALTTLESLRDFPLPVAEGRRLDLYEANAARSISDFDTQLRAAARIAADQDVDRRSRLFARAVHLEADALWRLARYDEAFERAELAQDAAVALDDLSATADALNTQAIVHYMLGDNRQALARHMEALQLFDQVGNRSGIGWAHNNIANILWDQGELAAAEQRYLQALESFEAIELDRGSALALLNAGTLAVDRAHLGRAGELVSRALELARAIGDRDLEASAMSVLGATAIWEGRSEGALALFDEALALHTELAQSHDAALVRRGMARAQLTLGRFEQAAELARLSATSLAELGAKDEEARSRCILALALASLDKLQAARVELDLAGSLAAAVESRMLFVELELTRSELALFDSDVEEALRLVELASAESTAIGADLATLRAVWLRSQIAKRSGVAAPELSAELEAKARRAGAGLFLTTFEG